MRKSAIVIMVVLITGFVCMSGCSGDSSSGGCKSYQQPGVTLSVNQTSIQANGATTITASVMVLDEQCQAFPVGTQVVFSLSDQTPSESGKFTNDQNTMNGSLGIGGFTTVSILSVVQGTANLNVTVQSTALTATPIALTFTGLVQNLCTIALSADPMSIAGSGTDISTITAVVTNYAGQPVSDGTIVEFTTNEGTFTDSSDIATYMVTTNGVASVALRSEVVTDTVTAEVSARFICNDPALSIYSDQTNVRFMLGAATDDPFMILAAAKDNLLADGISKVALTATVFGSDGGDVGSGVSVTFTTDLGSFDGSNPAQTNADGQAKIDLLSGLVGGTTTVTAEAVVEGVTVTAEYSIRLKQIGYVEYISTDFTKLGVRGSGRNETTGLTFRVRDVEGNPFSNIMVVFSMSLAPGVVLEPYQARTDAQGYVRTIVKSGITATTVTVTATVDVGLVTMQATSPALSITGAYPSARYLTFACKRSNVDGMIWVNAQTECIAMLADRYSNKIGFATEVAFMTEAGHVTPSALTGVDGNEMGLAVTEARTGMPMPIDVDPLELPYEERYMVSIAGNEITRNPRDGLVTMIAYTTGEEDFVDINENGVYDPPALPDFEGEPFVDLGEPFVDVNDNGKHDPEENLFVDVDGDGEYDGPNGTWDENTVIWTPTWMIWTGHLYEATIDPCDGFVVPYGGSETFQWKSKDFNLNPLNYTTRYSVTVEGKGKLGGSQPRLPLTDADSLGTDIFLFKVRDRDTMEQCKEFGVDRDIECYWMPVVTGFTYGVGGTFVVRGADVDPEKPEPPGAGTITLEIEYKDTSGKQFFRGIICEGLFGI